jgi:hypothetical protein
MMAAVSQDYMCEDFMLAKTGLSVMEHQRLTIERYDELVQASLPVYIMPVLQGYDPAEYASHVSEYGSRLKYRAWTGVGSVCKRNGSPMALLAVLRAVKTVRPDLRLHGFGVKITSLASLAVRNLLFSTDSMAWSFAARRAGRDANAWQEAVAYQQRVMSLISDWQNDWHRPSAGLDGLI